jgi:ABC-2 type transport system permease protein
LKRILAIMGGALRTWFRSKHTLFWTLAFPLLLMLLFGAIFSVSDDPRFDFYIQNQDIIDGEPSPFSAAFVDMLNETGVLNIKNVDAAENTATYIDEKGVELMLLIPEGFHQSCLTQNATVVLKTVPPEVDTSAATVRGVVESIAEAFNIKFNMETTGTIPLAVVTVQPESLVSENYRFIDYFVPGLIGMTLMTTGIFGAVGWNTRNRELGILKKLATTPLSKFEWIIGVVLFELVMCAISTTVILAVGVLVFDLRVLPSIYSIILIVAGAITFPGMGMVIARFVKETDSADAAANAITFPMMFLSGSFFPLEMMPNFLREIAKVLPLTYLNNGLRDSMVYGNASSALYNTAIVLVVGIAFIIIGSLITSWREE